MSNNKTIVPGMGNNFEAQELQTPNFGASQPTQTNNYTGTHFPGMNNGGTVGANVPQKSDIHKPLMGFFFSVSRTGQGEYWPLYMGLNTIGRASTNSVCLQEATISENHAEIVIRQMKNPDSVMVSIRDSRSTCGTLINGSSLGFEPHECHNGDIITIGEHYELYFILIDTKSLKLEPCADFIAVGAPALQQPANSIPGMPSAGSPFGAIQHGTPNYGVANDPAANNGATVIMPAKK